MFFLIKPRPLSGSPASAAAPGVKIMILTYKRSGSTFLGDLFDQSPDVFYVFEPLFGLGDKYVTKQNLSAMSRTV